MKIIVYNYNNVPTELEIPEGNFLVEVYRGNEEITPVTVREVFSRRGNEVDAYYIVPFEKIEEWATAAEEAIKRGEGVSFYRWEKFHTRRK